MKSLLQKLILGAAAQLVRLGLKPYLADLIAAAITVIIFLLISGGIIFFIFGEISSCGDSRYDKKIIQTQGNISNAQTNAAVSETIANVQENKVINQEVKVNEEANISARANANYNAVIKRDSGTFSNRYTDAVRNFCADADHAGDSLCRNK